MSGFLTAGEVAEKLGLKRDTIYLMARQRRIEVVVIGNKRKFTQEAVDKFIKEHTLPAKE